MLIMLWSWSWHGLEHIVFFITQMMMSCCLFRGAKWKLWVWTVHCWWESLGSARHKVWSVAAMCFLQPEVHRFLPSSTSFSSAMRIPTSSESCIWEELNFLSAVLNGSANNSGWKQQKNEAGLGGEDKAQQTLLLLLLPSHSGNECVCRLLH